jgi:hypothetical protein
MLSAKIGNSWRAILCQALAASLLSAIVLAQAVNPGKDWERARPEAEGYSSKRLDVLKGSQLVIFEESGRQSP